jgi:hypothetical protein
MANFDSFADFASHYAELTSAEAFPAAFRAEIGTAQLSIADEPTSEDMPDEDAARACVEQMTGDLFALFAETRLAPLAPRIAWGMVNSLHKVAQQLAREEDDAARDLGELARINDPSEIHAYDLEDKQRRCQSLHEAIAAIECMRDHAAEVYRVNTGKPWMATSGSRTSRVLTASQIEARDYLAARKAEQRARHLPTGLPVVVSGGKHWLHHEPIWQRLDAIRARVPSLWIATTGQRTGTDAIATAWAASRGVQSVPFILERRHGNRAGFKRNEQLLALCPVEAIICEGSGLQVNLAQTARAAGLPVTIFRNSDFATQPQRKEVI